MSNEPMGLKLSRIVRGWEILAVTGHLYYHDNICKYIHYHILQDLGFIVSTFWSQHKPNSSAEIENILVMYDIPIQTERYIKHNIPDNFK